MTILDGTNFNNIVQFLSSRYILIDKVALGDMEMLFLENFQPHRLRLTDGAVPGFNLYFNIKIFKIKKMSVYLKSLIAYADANVSDLDLQKL